MEHVPPLDTSNTNESYVKANIDDIFYPGAFHDFYEHDPPAGWMVRDGALIYNASIVVPRLRAALLTISNYWKLRTEVQWQLLSAAAGGIGGVPFFVLNNAADTIRLPDTRGDYVRCAGNVLLPNVGDWHGDAFRSHAHQITNILRLGASNWNYGSGGASFGTVVSDETGGNETRTRAFAMLGCVYVGA